LTVVAARETDATPADELQGFGEAIHPHRQRTL
jgi:hypothetical protein